MHRLLALCITALQVPAGAWVTTSRLALVPRGIPVQMCTSDSDSVESLRAERDRIRRQLAAAELQLRQKKLEISSRGQPVAAERKVAFNYGFASKSAEFDGAGQDATGPPLSAARLSYQTFTRELKGFRAFIGLEDPQETEATQIGGDLDDDQRSKQTQLRKLVLSNAAVWRREEKRPPIKSPLVIRGPYYVLCYMLDYLFEESPISRFWFLETVARMPYFSYITLIHTYETLGWWRRSSDTKRIHFAEEVNEYNHLKIMESLGGDQEWRTRFLAQHAAFIYFFVLIALWALSPTLAYNFSELIEAHAVDTYTEFADSNEELMKSLPAPVAAKEYYEGPDMTLFDEFQTGMEPGSRRPKINNLYDVFMAIAGDEKAHVATMNACQDQQVLISSPTTEAAVLATLAVAFAVGGSLASSGDMVAAEEDLGKLEELFSFIIRYIR